MDITMQRIISELEMQGKNQTKLADYLGVTSNVITDWKSGRIKSYSKYLHAEKGCTVAEACEILRKTERCIGATADVKKLNW